ncbi:MAG: hypothetical protein ACT4P1_12395 [Sporichthyaceae bacterium]
MTTETPPDLPTSAPAPAQPTAAAAPQLETFACATCGGARAYDAGREDGDPDSPVPMFGDRDPHKEMEFYRLLCSPRVICRTCGDTEALEWSDPVTVRPYPADTAGAAGIAPLHQGVTSCPGCASPLTFDATQVGSPCGSCGMSLLSTALPGSGWAAVDGVLPLHIDEATARRRIMAEASITRVSRGKKAAYRAAKLELRWLPALVVTADTVTEYKGEVVRVRRDEDGKSTTSRKKIEGRVEVAIEVSVFTTAAAEALEPKGGAGKMPLPGLGKFRRNTDFRPIHTPGDAIAFRREYIAGAPAHLPEGGFGAYRAELESRARAQILSAISKQTGAGTPHFDIFDTVRTNEGYRVVLVPVYVGVAQVGETSRKLWVDGCTGIATIEAGVSLIGFVAVLLYLVLLVALAFAAGGLILGTLLLLVQLL